MSGISEEQYYLAINAFDRMKIGGPSMEGRQPFHGSLTMDEYGAFQAIFTMAYQATQPTDSEVIDQLVDFVRTPEWSVSMLEDIAEIVRQARPDMGDEYDTDDPRAWRRH